MKIGYARVSTVGQDLETQIAKLQNEGCEKIFHEKQSGKLADNRPELKRAIEFAREGDVFTITKLDRLARSMGDLWQIIHELEVKKVAFKVLDQAGLDTSHATGKLLLNILGSIAEFERDLINTRTAEGREAAKQKGVKFGRRPSLTPDKVQLLKAEATAGLLSKEALAAKYGISRNTVYRLLDMKNLEQT
ncbi:recombinase family protein [uncultured Thiothrix sp.]|uniref:recombinase family protein n=1 Tax=uncultured Thiothrix sp. TaxID=223185 RepID=UPI0026272C13|nr:recombinase family protein [uncultured Thiothrix sp.]